ncbi:Fur family transcriptional regulator, iron response regulator [Ectothiorhodospira magna]|uniref:Ferric uptake regulation protein n=1 Tax=Ectothiorhodospira magna TaxID=867345 RepID=A0A1H9GPF2_9GAMM|nr:transcriptional repressor [Ectothiorhodospira magna]SEQ51920.1 Fur family transcriptional regulator, iron response regulator [Ectothiorhodospira magna]
MKRKQRNTGLDREAVVRKLREHGITPTQQRVDIATVLFKRPQHVCADQVLAQVNAVESLVSKATVYNTLGLFAKKGLIREVRVDPTRLFYDSNMIPHHHMYHTDSGMLEDVAPGQVGLDSLPEAPEGMVIEGVDVVIRVRRA